jgi:ornithine cyclodeaminase/alanine dehydrogenase-like protein (mu-crystallin family)
VKDGILYLRRQDVCEAASDIDAPAVIARTLRLHACGQAVVPDEAYLGWTPPAGGAARSLNMPGYLAGETPIAGTKIINSNPRNPIDRLPRASGLTLLFDPETGRVTCAMEGAYISALRTASVSAVASDQLARTTVEQLAILGAGELARSHLKLLPTRLPGLREIRVFDVDASRAAQLAREVPEIAERGVTLRVAESAESAARGAGIIVAVTTTTTGYIPLEWVEAGCLLLNVSLDDALPEVVLGVDRIIVDDWQLVSQDNRRLLGRMYRAGQVVGPLHDRPLRPDVRRVDAELGWVLIGREPGRRSDTERILVNPFGLSIEDIALADEVRQAACRKGLGLVLDR